MLFAALLLQLVLTNPSPFLVIDMNGEVPVHGVSSFSAEQYMSRQFPIYALDLMGLIAATEKTARLIESRQARDAEDTLRAGHTLVILRSKHQPKGAYSIRLVTQIDRPRFFCDFTLVRNEKDRRKAQVRLLAFADYLSR